MELDQSKSVIIKAEPCNQPFFQYAWEMRSDLQLDNLIHKIVNALHW